MTTRVRALLLILIATAAPATAAPHRTSLETESTSQPRLTAGVLASVNFSGLAGETELIAGSGTDEQRFMPSAATTLRWSAGGFIAAALTAHLGVRVEVRYSQRGGVAEQSLGGGFGSGDGFELDYDLRYVEVPVLATVSLPYDGGFGYQLFAGPSVGYLLAAELIGEGSAALPGTTERFELTATEDLTDAAETIELAAVLGGAARFPLPRGTLVLDVRYYYGVRAVIDTARFEPVRGLVAVEVDELRNRGLMLSLGFEL